MSVRSPAYTFQPVYIRWLLVVLVILVSLLVLLGVVHGSDQVFAGLILGLALATAVP